MTYPPARRDESVVDTLHGKEVRDPYRWLEDTWSKETGQWIVAQNKLSEAHLAQSSLRETFRTRLTTLWNTPRESAPRQSGRSWFQFRNDGLQNQDVLWAAQTEADATTPPGRSAYKPFLDMNEQSESGSLSITAVTPSPNGLYLAYAISDSGSDWMTWFVRNTETGRDEPDRVLWSKFGDATWLEDSTGFFYAGYDEPSSDESSSLLESNRHQSIRFHRLGTETSNDPIVFERPDHLDWLFEASISDGGKWVVVTIRDGSAPVDRIQLIPFDKLEENGYREDARLAQPLLAEGDANYRFLGSWNDQLYFLTDNEAPNYRVVAVHPNTPSPGDWITIVPEGADRILSAKMFGHARPEFDGWLAVETLHHATSQVEILDLTGQSLRRLKLQPNCTLTSWVGGAKSDHLQYTTSTFTSSNIVVSHCLRTGTSTLLFSVENAAVSREAKSEIELVTEQVFVESGGAQIPVFLIHRADVQPNGDIPTILYGYGGFDVPITPAYSRQWYAWAEQGGLVAVACLRGGGEYGRSWHDAGRLHNKQNVFNDAIAVAEWLTSGEDAWSNSARLGATGRSNGGLLAGALLTQRPDLFGACVPEVGVLDMLRYHLFTIGWAWIVDFGSPEEPEFLETLLAYSPLHNVKDGVSYPPTLVTTGDHDDRVVPGHSFKFAAALQSAQSGSAPIVVRIDTAAGHGAGKPTAQLVAERTDVLAFFAEHLGLASMVGKSS